MSSALQGLLKQLSAALGSLSPFAKAVAPAAATLVTVLVNSLLAGSFNSTSVVIAAVGLGSAALAYLFPNIPLTPPAGK